MRLSQHVDIMQDILQSSQVHGTLVCRMAGEAQSYSSTNAHILIAQILQTNYQIYVQKEIEKTKVDTAKLQFYQMASASLQQQDQGDRLKVCFCVHLYMISIQS